MTTPSTRQRLRETAERAKVNPDLMTAIDPGEFLDLLSSLDRMEAELERLHRLEFASDETIALNERLAGQVRRMEAVVRAAVEWRKNERELDEHAMAGTEAPVHLRQADWQTIDEMRKSIDAYLTTAGSEEG